MARGLKLHNYLSKVIANSEVYIDRSKSKGQNWKEINDKQLGESNIVIVVLTPAALQSSEVKREVELAKKLNKRTLPCKDEALDLEWNKIPWGLAAVEGIEFEDDEILKTRLFREINKIIKELKNASTDISPEQIQESTNVKVYDGAIPIILNSQTFNMTYCIKNGSLRFNLAKVDKEACSIIIDFECKDDSTFELTLPRILIDSKSGSEDDVFFVLVDGVETEFDEKKLDNERILKISVRSVSRRIEIVGTQLLGISFTGVTKPENIVKILNGSDSTQTTKYLEPQILTIKQGEKVSWENSDKIGHTITSGKSSDNQTGMIFDSGLIAAGKSFEIVFNENGTYDYFCQVHPRETGQIIVHHILKDSKLVEPTFDKKEVLSKIDSIIETHAQFAEKKSQLNYAIKQYDECWTLVKQSYPARSNEIELLKIKTVSLGRLLLAGPEIEFQRVKTELLGKAKRLRDIVEYE